MKSTTEQPAIRPIMVHAILSVGLIFGLLPPASIVEIACLADSSEKEKIEFSPKVEIIDVRTISWKPPLYHGWPTLARRSDGELLLAFSGGREQHVCPFGRLEWMRSMDGGLTWAWPQVLYDGPMDDRDAGVVETAKGSILVTTFTSNAYVDVLKREEKKAPDDKPQPGTPMILAEWQAAHQRITDEQRQSELGCYMIRSSDGGVTWSARYRVPLNSPHGPIVLRDGRLLYPGKALRDDGAIGVCESLDDGLTWSWLGKIPARPDDSVANYHELHAVEAANGRLICHIRNHNPNEYRETLQSESDDGGKTWSIPHSIGVWGFPSHLIRLRNGDLLMSYSYRKKPLGNQARLSRDHGQTWSDPLTISADGSSGDLGYPSTVECNDGTLVTVWYEVIAGSPLAQLRQARWRFR
jgi:sialidase-1